MNNTIIELLIQQNVSIDMIHSAISLYFTCKNYMITLMNFVKYNENIARVIDLMYAIRKMRSISIVIREYDEFYLDTKYSCEIFKICELVKYIPPMYEFKSDPYNIVTESRAMTLYCDNISNIEKMCYNMINERFIADNVLIITEYNYRNFDNFDIPQFYFTHYNVLDICEINGLIFAIWNGCSFNVKNMNGKISDTYNNIISTLKESNYTIDNYYEKCASISYYPYLQ